MKKYLYLLSSLLLLVTTAVCQTTKVYHYNDFTKTDGTILSSRGAKEDHTVTLFYDANNKLIKITDAASYRTDTYVIDKTVDSWGYDLHAYGHSKKSANWVYEFTHCTKGRILPEQFTITVRDKDGYKFDDGSTKKEEILSNKD